MKRAGLGASASLARARPFALLLLMGCLWGSTFSLAKIATEAGGHPLGLAFSQGIFGGLFLFLISLLRRRLPGLSRRHLVFYLICGLFGGALPGVLFFYAAPRVPAGVLSISIAAVPILTFAAALALGLERVAFGRIAGLLLGIFAVVLIVAPESSLPDPAMAPWVLVAVLAGSCYAAENLFVALRRPPDSDTLSLACGMLLMAGLVLAPAVLATDSFVPLGLPWGELEWAVAGLVVFSAVPYAIFIHVIETSGPVFAAQTAYVVTLSGVLWGIVIFGERHSPWIWSALAVMLVGLALVTPRLARAPA